MSVVSRIIRISDIRLDISSKDVENEISRILSRDFYDFDIVVVRPRNKKSRLAFVTFTSIRDAELAVKLHSRLKLFGGPVRVAFGNSDRKFRESRSPTLTSNVSDLLQQAKTLISHYSDDGIVTANNTMSDRSAKEFTNLDILCTKMPPSQTLFIGRLDRSIRKKDIDNVFERFGIIESIIIYNNNPGRVFAFVRFFNLFMARKALKSMIGKKFMNFDCLYGFGQTGASNILWIGGIGPWIDIVSLKKKFEEFGDVKHIEWPSEKNFAYIEYFNIRSARKALEKMRGTILGKKRINIDFSDRGQMTSHLNYSNTYLGGDSDSEDEAVISKPSRYFSSQFDYDSYNREVDTYVDEIYRSVPEHFDVRPNSPSRDERRYDNEIVRHEGRRHGISPVRSPIRREEPGWKNGKLDDLYAPMDRDFPDHRSKDFDIDREYYIHESKEFEMERTIRERDLNFSDHRLRDFASDQKFLDHRPKEFGVDLKCTITNDLYHHQLSPERRHDRSHIDTNLDFKKRKEFDERSLSSMPYKKHRSRSRERYMRDSMLDKFAMDRYSRRSPSDYSDRDHGRDYRESFDFGQSPVQKQVIEGSYRNSKFSDISSERSFGYSQSKQSTFGTSANFTVHQAENRHTHDKWYSENQNSNERIGYDLPHDSRHSPAMRFPHKSPAPHTVQMLSGFEGELVSGNILNTSAELLRKYPIVWSGGITFKNRCYWTCMSLISGSIPLVNTLLNDSLPLDMKLLKITQRLRLDMPEKLAELERRVDMAGRNGSSILLAFPSNKMEGMPGYDSQPLVKLNNFLKETQLAAIVLLPTERSFSTDKGVLHIFPRCQFSMNFLQREAPELTSNFEEGDNLLMIIVKDVSQ